MHTFIDMQAYHTIIYNTMMTVTMTMIMMMMMTTMLTMIIHALIANIYIAPPKNITRSALHPSSDEEARFLFGLNENQIEPQGTGGAPERARSKAKGQPCTERARSCLIAVCMYVCIFVYWQTWHVKTHPFTKRVQE